MVRACADIDLSVFSSNLGLIRRSVGETKLILVIKANAYGLGAVPIAKKAESLDVHGFAVATLEEAIELRSAGIRKPILLLSEFAPDVFPKLLELDLTPIAYTLPFLEKMNTFAMDHHKKMTVHVKVDTGMGRLGVCFEEAEAFLSNFLHFDHLVMGGIMTHLASSDLPESGYTEMQLDRFNTVLEGLAKKGVRIPEVHASNSFGISFPAAHFTHVRIGFFAYENMLRLKSYVHLLKRIKTGESVGYGNTFVANSETQIAVVPFGYADGYPRALSGRAFVLISGKRYRVIQVCMDFTIVELGIDYSVSLRDEVVLLGGQGDEVVTVQEIAAWSQHEIREVYTRIGNRVERRYLNF